MTSNPDETDRPAPTGSSPIVGFVAVPASLLIAACCLFPPLRVERPGGEEIRWMFLLARWPYPTPSIGVAWDVLAAQLVAVVAVAFAIALVVSGRVERAATPKGPEDAAGAAD
jgi:hypothetical protein